MAGRQQVPDVIKLKTGTLRKCRVRKNQPKPTGGIGRSPFPQRSIAGRKWKEVTTGLKRLGIIDSVDATQIENLCHAYQCAKEADKLIAEQGFTLIKADGSPVKNPNWTVSSDAWHKVRMLCNDLGLTHLSRQRMTSTTKQETSFAEEFIG